MNIAKLLLHGSEIPWFPSERNAVILPSEIKQSFHYVSSQYQLYHKQKYHWVSDNEQQS